MESFVSWDVTASALGWYNGSGKGALIFVAEGEDTQQSYASFVGDRWLENSPYFIVQYRNSVGLEDYYTYQTTSVARAGTVYIGDFTNQLTLTNTDASVSNGAVSAEVTHVYNSAYANTKFTGSQTAIGLHTQNYSNMELGSGWKLSVQQTVVPITIDKDEYLVYNDADGTEHYFPKTTTNIYKDEDGLGLKIVKSTSGGNTVYTMTDTDALNTWVFHNGYLISITDSNGNATYIAYNNRYSSSSTSWKPVAGSANKIVQVAVKAATSSTVTDVATMAYSGSKLSSITSIASGVTRTTYYNYTGNYLTQIKYADNCLVKYQYNANGYMTKAFDGESKYGQSYDYRWGGHGGYVFKKVTEFTATDIDSEMTAGNAFHAYKPSSQLTQYRFYGADHEDNQLITGGDDIVASYVFDHSGRTICSYEQDSDKRKILGATSASYTGNSGTNGSNNKLTGAAALGRLNATLSLDSGFENTSTLAKSNGEVSILTVSSTTDTHVHNGYKSMHFNRTSTEESGGYQQVYLEAEKTYTFSAYVSSCNATAWDESSSYGQLAVRQITDNGDTPVHASEKFSTQTVSDIDRGWERVSTTFTVSSSGQYYVGVVTGGFTGSYYVDDFQIEEGDCPTPANLLLNGSVLNSDTISRWECTSGNTVTLSTEQPFAENSRTYKLVSTPVNSAVLKQEVKIYDNEAGSYILSGWAKGNAVGSSSDTYDGTVPFFGLLAAVVYVDGPGEEWHQIAFDNEYRDWQYASVVVQPKKDKAVKLIRVYVLYYRQANTAYFSNISLVREPAQTYTYDDKGNPVSAKDGGAKTNCEYQSGTQLLSKYTSSTGVVTSFTYDSNKNLATTTTNGVTSTNTYNAAGLVTQTISSGVYSGYPQITKNTYDVYGNRASTTDANGASTGFVYNTRGQLSRTTLPTGAVQEARHNYLNDRFTTNYISGATIQRNIYDDHGNLSDVSRKLKRGGTDIWQTYTYTFDAFGNPTELKVNNKNGDVASGASTGTLGGENEFTLATYAYEDYVNNGRLSKMTYGNDASIDYTYDKFDRVTSEKYNNHENDSNSITNNYVYSSDGSLAKKTSTTGESYEYEYDSLGRLIRSKELDDGGFVQRTEHIYDASDRLTRQAWHNGSGTTSQVYTYGATNGFLTKISTAAHGNTLNVGYTYNIQNQLRSRDTTVDGSALFKKLYNYAKINSDANSTNLPNFCNYRTADESAIFLSNYSYNAAGLLSRMRYGHSTDSSGNTVWEETYTYDYDNRGQLTSATYGGATHTYTYDTGGNILSKDGKSYTYGNLAWADLLTEYDGHTITYDAIGNPLSYYNGTSYAMTWEKGRQLATASTDSASVSYAYDMAGVRSSKTVNGVAYNFDTLSGQVMRQTWGGNTLEFIYDEVGTPYAMLYTPENGTTQLYYYVTNALGDVVGLMNSSASIVAEYRYDPWGKLISTTGDTALAELNPLRYKGYYYDTETGFYYLQTRYYDPEIGRFINADSFITTDITGLLSTNMFAYCENNPVNYYDYSGYIPIAVEDKIIHNEVLARICGCNPDLSWKNTCIYYNGVDWHGGFGFCDLYNPITGEIWELKKASNSYSCRTTTALRQLERYTSGRLKNNPELELRKPYLTTINSGNFSFTQMGYNYQVNYWSEGNGILRYSYDRQKTEERQVVELAITIGVVMTLPVVGQALGEAGLVFALLP